MEAFSSFVVMVLEDTALRDELLEAPDLSTLIERVIALGKERGIAITREELDAIVNTNRRSWLERWTDL